MNKRQEILDELALTRTLSNESLAGMDFSQEDFSNCAFMKIDFSDTKLVETDFTSCQLVQCDFTRADLTRAIGLSTGWLNPIFDETVFVDVDLRACQMMGAKITNARLNGGNLYNTILHDVEMPGLVLKGKLSRFIANDCTFDEIDAAYLEMNRCIFFNFCL